MSDTLKWSTAPANTFLMGAEWQGPMNFPGSSTSMPALTVFQNTPWCMHRGGGTNQELWYTNYDNLTGGWVGETKVSGGQQTISSPALAEFKGKLYCAYAGTDNGLYVTWSDGSPNWNIVPTTVSSPQGPGLAEFNGQLWYVYTNLHDKKLYCRTSTDGQNWGAPNALANVEASDAPALVKYAEQLWCVYRAHDTSALYVLTSNDGQNWTAPVLLAGTAAIARRH